MAQWKKWGLPVQILVLAIVFLVLYRLAGAIDIGHFLGVIAPFLIGLAIAYILSRPVAKVKAHLEKSSVKFIQKRAHSFSVILIFLIAIALVAIIISYVVPIIVSNLADFVGNIAGYIGTVRMWIDSVEPDSWIYDLVPGGNSNFMSDFSLETLFMQLSLGTATIVRQVMSVTTGLMNATFSLIFALYTLLYKDSILALVNRIAKVFIKENTLGEVQAYVHKSNEIFYKFVSAQFLDACILGTLATIMLAIFGVEYAVTLGLLLGICNMIPFFGSIFASVVTTIVTLFTGGVVLALIAFVALLILQQIDANFIGPKITGDALGLNPLLIIFSIMVGGAYFGVVGMFISVPIAAMCKMFLEDFLANRERELKMK